MEYSRSEYGVQAQVIRRDEKTLLYYPVPNTYANINVYYKYNEYVGYCVKFESALPLGFVEFRRNDGILISGLPDCMFRCVNGRYQTAWIYYSKDNPFMRFHNDYRVCDQISKNFIFCQA